MTVGFVDLKDYFRIISGNDGSIEIIFLFFQNFRLVLFAGG